MTALHVVFDGSLPDARFVEVETPDGFSVDAGRWNRRADGLNEMIIPNVVVWKPISERPRDKTILVTVRRRAGGAPVGVFAAYVDDDGVLCNVETWKPDQRDLDGPIFYASHWAPMPEAAP